MIKMGIGKPLRGLFAVSNMFGAAFKRVAGSLRSLHIAGRRIVYCQRVQEIPIAEYTAFWLMYTSGPRNAANTGVNISAIRINMP